MLWKSVKEDIQDIVTYMQQFGMAQEFHSEYIKLLLEGVTKHFSLHSEHPFQEKDLELRGYINKAIRKPTVPIRKELNWVLQNWYDIMAFMMCGRQLGREVHTAGDSSDLVQQGISSYQQPPRNIGKGSDRVPKTSTNTTFTTKSATE